MKTIQKLLANSFLMIALLAMLFIPIGIMGLSGVSGSKEVLSETDTREDVFQAPTAPITPPVMYNNAVPPPMYPPQMYQNVELNENNEETVDEATSSETPQQPSQGQNLPYVNY